MGLPKWVNPFKPVEVRIDWFWLVVLRSYPLQGRLQGSATMMLDTATVIFNTLTRWQPPSRVPATIITVVKGPVKTFKKPLKGEGGKGIRLA
jgi:hypothetical protein